MKEINPYLKEVEKFLEDLPILDRNKIISDLNSELLENNEILKRPASVVADEKRIEAGFDAYKVKNSKSSFGRVIFKTFAFMFVCFLIFIGFLMWKFTPLLKIDEENQKVTILGGLIDIDGKSGKFIVGDEVHFTASNYTNDLTGSIVILSHELNSTPIKLNFESGKFTFQTSPTDDFSFECKLSSPPTEDMITQAPNSIVLNFKELEGSNCTISIPEKAKFFAKGETAAVDLVAPHFDFDLELESGNIVISPDENRTYDYDLKVETGILSDYTSTDDVAGEHKIRIRLESGNISK